MYHLLLLNYNLIFYQLAKLNLPVVMVSQLSLIWIELHLGRPRGLCFELEQPYSAGTVNSRGIAQSYTSTYVYKVVAESWLWPN